MTVATATPDATSDRRHDIDALRVCAFGLLILFHIGMFYVPWGWHVKSAASRSLPPSCRCIRGIMAT